MENPRRKVNNPKYDKIPYEERNQISTHYLNALNQIEEVEDEIFDANNLWEPIFNYYHQNVDKKLWK